MSDGSLSRQTSPDRQRRCIFEVDRGTNSGLDEFLLIARSIDRRAAKFSTILQTTIRPPCGVRHFDRSSRTSTDNPGLMPIRVQCANGHHLRVESSLAGKRIRCRRCGETLIVPSDPHVAPDGRQDGTRLWRGEGAIEPDESRDSDRARGDDTRRPHAADRPSPVTQPIRGELIPADLPELRLPGSKRRGHSRSVHVRDEVDAADASSDGSRRSADSNRGDLEPIDFLFDHHPHPVARRFPIAVSIAIVMSPLLLYFGLRFAVGSIPQEYFADVKRMAVQRANHNGRSALGASGPGGGSIDDLSSAQRETDENRMLIRGVCLGGNGRYLATYHAPVRPGAKRSFVRVEDLQDRQELGTLMIEGPHLSLAASADTLVVGGWGSASLQSFRLPSLQRLHHRLVPPQTAPISLAMGHASQGPLYVINAQSRLEVRDVSTLSKISHVGKLDEARLLFDKRSLCNASG